jgi:hypothetical protein
MAKSHFSPEIQEAIDKTKQQGQELLQLIEALRISRSKYMARAQFVQVFLHKGEVLALDQDGFVWKCLTPMSFKLRVEEQEGEAH